MQNRDGGEESPPFVFGAARHTSARLSVRGDEGRIPLDKWLKVLEDRKVL